MSTRFAARRMNDLNQSPVGTLFLIVRGWLGAVADLALTI